MSLPATVQFQNHMLQIHEHQGQPWLTPEVIAEALGYFEDEQGYPLTGPTLGRNELSRPVRKIYERHSDEFTEKMTTLIRMQTEGGMQMVRVFSARGCYIITLLARTKKAKAFRAWVLDVLEGLVQPDTQPQSMPHSLSHRADAVVSASRTFNALMRSAKTARLPTGKSLRVALEKSQMLTGVDLAALLEITPPSKDADYEDADTDADSDDSDSPESGMHHLLEQLPRAEAVRAYAESRSRFTLEDLIAEIYPGEDSRSLRTRLGHVLDKLGFRRYRVRAYCPRAGKALSRGVYRKKGWLN